MKQFSVFMVTLLLIILAANNKNIYKLIISKTTAPVVQTKNEVRGIARAMHYVNSMRANQETGLVNPADVLRAHRHADQKLQHKSSLWQWDFMGPNNVGGRTRALLVDNSNTNRLYAGSVAGGLWISNDGGASWTGHPQNNEWANQSIGTIAQAPNGDIYIGTGEGFYAFFGEAVGGVPGGGIYKSTDGGTTFSALENTVPAANEIANIWAAINRIAVNPIVTGDNNEHLVYTANSFSTSNFGYQNDGVFRMSANGGATWVVPEGIPVHNAGQGWDVQIASNGTVHVVLGDQYYRSTNGYDFTMLSGNNIGDFPVNNNRKAIAISPENPNYLYAVLTDGACLDKIIRSTDGGDTWYTIGVGGNSFFEPFTNSLQCQGNYDLAISVDPANENRIFLAGVTLWTWSDTENWLQVDNLFNSPSNASYVHADKHFIAFNPSNPNTMYITSDGGVTRTDNAGDTYPTFYTINSNYNVTQFYSVAAGFDGRVMGGTQDNGTQYVTLDGPSYLAGTEVHGGDGGYVEMSKINPNIMFAANPEGVLLRSSNGGESFGSGFLDQHVDAWMPYGALDGEPLFVTPFFLYEDIVWDTETFTTPDVENSTARFFTGNGIGEVFMTNEALNPSVVPNWGKIGEFANNVAVTTITAGKDDIGNDMAIVGSSNGRLLIIRNLDGEYSFAGTFDTHVEEINAVGTDLAGRYITGIAIDHNNPTTIIVTAGNYGNANNIFKINNIFSSPEIISIQGEGTDALPAMPIYDVIINKDASLQIILATELGVWLGEANNFDNVVVWQEVNGTGATGIGRVPTFDIRQEAMNNMHCNVVYIGTHGRGLYRSTSLLQNLASFCSDYLELPNWSSTNVNEAVAIEQISMLVSPNPITNNGQLSVRVPKATQLHLQIYNMQGQELLHRNLGAATVGTHHYNIDVNKFLAGNYIAIVTDVKHQYRASKRVYIHK